MTNVMPETVFQLQLPHPGCEREELPLRLVMIGGRFVFRGQLFLSLYMAAKYGRIWYLPTSGRYGFRVEISPPLGICNEMWVTVDDLFSAEQAMAGLSAQRVIEETEPRRARVTSADYFEGLGHLRLMEMRRDAALEARKLSLCERTLLMYQEEPFKGAAAVVTTYPGRRRRSKVSGQMETRPVAVEVSYFDGSSMLVGRRSVATPMITTQEVGDAATGRTWITTEWDGNYGHA